MSWKTLYITGKDDFRQDVRRKLEHSSIPSMPGYMDFTPDQPADLYWLDGTVPLRQIKETIGSKLIFRHRLQFYNTLEEFMAARDSKPSEELTARERQMITEMRAAS